MSLVYGGVAALVSILTSAESEASASALSPTRSPSSTALGRLVPVLSIKAAYESVGDSVKLPDIFGGATVRLGDDCAALQTADGWLLFAMEGLIELFVNDAPWFAGYSAVMVNTSDIYAMKRSEPSIRSGFSISGWGPSKGVFGNSDLYILKPGVLARRRLRPARRIRQFDRDGCRTAGFSRLAYGGAEDLMRGGGGSPFPLRDFRLKMLSPIPIIPSTRRHDGNCRGTARSTRVWSIPGEMKSAIQDVPGTPDKTPPIPSRAFRLRSTSGIKALVLALIIAIVVLSIAFLLLQ
ncbi:MAG: hypothetical protein JO151_16195 [Verrucomicrobia bacterium]|nr:hypothetical protein [Verrucomicrobiota bacterium]